MRNVSKIANFLVSYVYIAKSFSQFKNTNIYHVLNIFIYWLFIFEAQKSNFLQKSVSENMDF